MNVIAASFLALVCAVGAFAQAPTPAPELKKLDYFVGTWSMTGENKPGPMGPGGPFTGTDKHEWMDGKFFLITHSEGSGSWGSMKALATWGYNSDEKVYTFHEVTSMGEDFVAKGTVNGDDWTWTTDDKNGKGRYTMKILSPTSFAIKFEMAPPGGDYFTVMEGKATKK